VLHLRGKIIESERVVEQSKVESEATEKFKNAISEPEDKKK
jgi:hypothetical protein